MTGGMHYTPTHTNVCKFLNFQLTFSQLILHLKCWNLAGLLKLRCSFYCWYTFLILANFSLFQFSAAILEKGLFVKFVKSLGTSSSVIIFDEILFQDDSSFCPSVQLRFKHKATTRQTLRFINVKEHAYYHYCMHILFHGLNF